MRWQWYLLVGLHMGLELITRELIKLVRGRPADAGLIVCASGNDYGASDSFVIQLNIYTFLA